jgi:Predicted Fe-S oxidoreductase
MRQLKNAIEGNNVVNLLLDNVAKTSLYNMIVQRNIDAYLANIKKNKRLNIILETSNICNAKCVMCPHIFMERKEGVMNDETFDLALRRIKESHINPVAFILNGFGEPLTDKKIIDRIKKTKQNFKDSKIKMYSNFNLADDKLINALLESGLDELNISFNGLNSDSYEKTMGINYGKTLRNLKKLLELKKERTSALKIRLSMALVTYNENGIREFIKKWERKVDSVSINRTHTYSGRVKDVSGKYKINFEKKAYPCKYLWNTIVIGVNGDVFLCCLDYNGKYTFGNIRNDNMLNIFYSKNFEKIRALHYSRQLKNLEICKYCYTPYKNGVEWFVNELY